MLSLALLFSQALPALAQVYLLDGQPDGRVLLPPPPEPGSAEALADLGFVRSVFKARTPAEEQRAFKDATLAFELFGPAVGTVFDLEKLPKTHTLLKTVKQEVGETINLPKNTWKRTRPYDLDPALKLGRPERSYSYPSGHSTRGMLYALVISELFPAKQKEIMEIGRNIGWDRVLIGKHYPSDVLMGRVLGQATFRELMKSPAFQRDLAASKAEIAAFSPKEEPAAAVLAQ